MKVLDRLKMELSNQAYFTDEQYIRFLAENSLALTNNRSRIRLQPFLSLMIIPYKKIINFRKKYQPIAIVGV